jgi:hypothetical protein
MTATRGFSAHGRRTAHDFPGGPVHGSRRRSGRAAAAISGAALLAASACTRFGVFHAGVASADDPKYTVVLQRERLGEPAAPAGVGRAGVPDGAPRR